MLRHMLTEISQKRSNRNLSLYLHTAFLVIFQDFYFKIYSNWFHIVLESEEYIQEAAIYRCFSK